MQQQVEGSEGAAGLPVHRHATAAKAGGDERLCVSPTFALARSFDGRPYLAQDCEPYTQYWLSERYHTLWMLFGARHGAHSDDVTDGYFLVTRHERTPAEARRVARAIADMREAGVLVGRADDPSRYDARIVDDYVANRPFPRELAALMVRSAGIGADSRVLDLAGGPGDLALALAETSRYVSLMELSKAFLTAARRRARHAGLALTTIHDSCNRLVHRDEGYDAVTVSQALHWLDDVMVCRGVCRVLRPGGSFFVVHGAIELDDAHPLAYVLGHDSVLGRKVRQAFAAEVAPLQRRLGLLFEALDAPDVQRVDPQQALAAADGATGATPARIVAAGTALFRQRRPFGPGYARGFLTDRHIEATGQAPAAFWHDLEARCASATPQQLEGVQHWAVLHFQRGAHVTGSLALDDCPVGELAYP